MSIVVVNVSIQVKNTESVDPFFTLVAKGFTPTQMDMLFLIKQQLARIGINLDVLWVDMPDGDTTKIRDYDLTIIDFQDYIMDDPFFADFYSENGTINVSGYESSIDWDEELGIGKNDLYIQTGLQMTPNDSQERINLCWEWQNYLLDDILPSLPLFTKVDDNSTFQILVFNLREVRPIIGSREPAPSYPSKSVGLGVRKAITYAIDRKEIKNIVLGDAYEIIHHPISPKMISWLNPDVVRYCHDLTAARDFMQTIMYDLHWIPNYEYTYIGYGDWPNWEDVCSKNMITYSNPGFDIFFTILVLVILSQIFQINRLKTKYMKKDQGKVKSIIEK